MLFMCDGMVSAYSGDFMCSFLVLSWCNVMCEMFDVGVEQTVKTNILRDNKDCYYSF